MLNLTLDFNRDIFRILATIYTDATAAAAAAAAATTTTNSAYTTSNAVSNPIPILSRLAKAVKVLQYRGAVTLDLCLCV